jgi:hypothetical protein
MRCGKLALDGMADLGRPQLEAGSAPRLCELVAAFSRPETQTMKARYLCAVARSAFAFSPKSSAPEIVCGILVRAFLIALDCPRASCSAFLKALPSAWRSAFVL